MTFKLGNPKLNLEKHEFMFELFFLPLHATDVLTRFSLKLCMAGYIVCNWKTQYCNQNDGQPTLVLDMKVRSLRKTVKLAWANGRKEKTVKMREKFSKRAERLSYYVVIVWVCKYRAFTWRADGVRSLPLRATHHHELSNPYSVALNGNVQINKKTDEQS